MLTASVVIRTRDEAPRLRLTLASLERQEGLAEIVVVDDGSSDATPLVLEEAARTLPLTIVRHHSPHGRSAAANAGAAAASADLLIFLDGDTLAGPGFVAAHCAAHCDANIPGSCRVGRGETWHVRSTRLLRDPERGEPFPGHEARYESLSERERLAMRLTVRDVCEDFARVSRRASYGVYPGAAPARLAEAEMAALRTAPPAAPLWAAASGSNQSVPRRPFIESGGFDAGIDINEHRELARRLVLRGAEMVAVDAAHSYHLIHRSGWRDPLQDRGWEDRFWARHPVPEVALLPVFWASLSFHPALRATPPIESLGQLAVIAAAHAGLSAATAGACRALMGYPETLA